MKKFSLALGVCVVLALSTSAFAQSLCTTESCVAPTDSINWGSQGLGAPGTVWTTPQNWITGTNSGEIGVVGPTNFTLMQQSVTWAGNFTPGDYLIWNQNLDDFTGNAGPIGIVFNTPVEAAGAQIQADFFGDFTATVCDQLGNCFSETGDSNGDSDGSAIFIGLKDPTAEIQFLTFTVTDINGNNDEAIDTAFFTNSSVTPEPCTLSLLGVGIGMLFLNRRRRTSC
jgi:hypothetical protein